MSFKFEKLKIWHKSMDFPDDIDKLTECLPDKEKYNLNTQIRRAADSIALNISEGAIGQTNPEQSKFIGYAIRSLAEVVGCLYKMKRRNYISEELFEEFYDESFHLMNMLIAFRNNIK